MNRILSHFRTRCGTALNNIEVFGRSNHRPLRSMASSSATKEEVKAPAKAEKKTGPVKFTESQAYLNYRSIDNFHGGASDSRELPKSHNYVLASTGIFGFFYLIILRDDVENDGGVNLFKPVHETIPELAIPMIQAAIVENRKLGHNTLKLEKKLEELMKEPERHGGGRRKLVEN